MVGWPDIREDLWSGWRITWMPGSIMRGACGQGQGARLCDRGAVRIVGAGRRVWFRRIHRTCVGPAVLRLAAAAVRGAGFADDLPGESAPFPQKMRGTGIAPHGLH